MIIGMITAGTFYTLVCDTCGERMEGPDEGGYLVTESLAEAEEVIGDRDWEKDDDGKLTCSVCIQDRELAA